jgi:phage/plasmid-like protein (TIGR03299 family)
VEAPYRPDLDLYRASEGNDVTEYATPQRSRVTGGAFNAERGLPWHVRMSVQLGEAPLMRAHDGKMTIPEALELGGLTWKVSKRGIQTIGGGRASRRITSHFATVREDTGFVLGIVGKVYKVHQIGDVLEFGDAILDAGGAIVETVGELHGGRIVFATLELPVEVRIGGLESETIRPYLILSTSFDGSRSLRVMLALIRVVCANTDNLAYGEAKKAGAIFAVRHTANLQSRILEARRVLGITFANVDAFQLEAEQLLATKLTNAEAERILARAFPIADDATERERARSISGGILQVYRESDNLGNIRGTAWGVLQAASEWTDHVRPVRGSEFGADDLRAYSVLFGSTIETKAKVLAALRRA